MGFKDTLDRIKHSRLAKEKASEHETRKHDEMAKKYDEKKKFHSSHNQGRPKEESARDKVLKVVMSNGKKFVESSRKKAQEESARQGKKKKKKQKTPSTPTRQNNEPRPQSQFNFGFGGNMEQFGNDMFSNKSKSKSKEESKQESKQADFNFGFGGNSDNIPYDEMYNFRSNADHSKLFKKRKADSLDEAWNPKDFWN